MYSPSRRGCSGPNLIRMGITHDRRIRLVAALVLHGAEDEEQAATVIARIPELSDTSGERLRDLTRWAGGSIQAVPVLGAIA